MVRRLVLRRVLFRRYGFDRQLQVLAVGIVDLGNAGPGTEHAAEARRARPVVERAARRMREWNGVDLRAPPRLRCPGKGERQNAQENENSNAPQHAANPTA